MADSSKSLVTKWFEWIWNITVATFLIWRANFAAILPCFSTHDGDPTGSRQEIKTESWQEQKEHFLRHPSLRSNTNRSGDTLLVESGKRKQRPPAIVPPNSTVELWTQTQRASVALRPYNPPEGVPAVIVTPSTPTGSNSILSMCNDFPFSTASASPLELAIANAPTLSRDSNRDAVSTATSAEHLPALLDLEKGLLYNNSPLAQFCSPEIFSPESLSNPRMVNPPQLMSCSATVHYNSSSSSAMSRSLPQSATHSWSDSNSPELPEMKGPSYVTSTPPMKRHDGIFRVHKLREEYDIFSNSGDTSPTSTEEYDDDSVPYPDVFDLDMYHDSVLATYRYSDSLGQPTDSFDALGFPKSSIGPGPGENPIRKQKRFAFVPSTLPSSPSADREIKRYRDHYRPPHYSRPPQLCATWGSPPLSITRLNPIANHSFSPTSYGSVSKSDSNRSFLQPGSYSPPGLSSSKKQRPIIPVVIASHNTYEGPFTTSSDQSSYSNQSGDWEDEESLAVLQRRLKETFENFGKSVYADPSETWEPVTF